MNKNEIKQIILEEIEDALKEMGMSPEMMAADSRPEEDDDITPPGIEDMSPDPMFGPDPSYVEEELAEMARTSNVFQLSQNADLKQVLQFMQRVNDVLKTYKSPGQKRPKKRFTPEEMKALATAMLKPEGFTSKDVIAATSYNSPAQANKFLKALEMKGLITLTSQLKKAQEPTRDPNAPETRGRKARSAEFDVADDPTAMDFGDFEDLDLSGFDDIYESAASNLELKSIGKQIFAELKKLTQGAVKITYETFSFIPDPNADPNALGGGMKNYGVKSKGKTSSAGFGWGGGNTEPQIDVEIDERDKIPALALKYSGINPDKIKFVNDKITQIYKDKIAPHPQRDNVWLVRGSKGRDASGMAPGQRVDTKNPGRYTGQAISENNTMTNLEKYIKQQIRESKQVRLQEAKASRNLKDLIALGLLASDRDKLTNPGTLNENQLLEGYITYQQAQDIIAQKGINGSYSISGVDLADIGPGEVLHTWFQGYDNPRLGMYGKAKIVDEKSVEQLLSNLNSIEVSPDSAADIAQQVMDSGLETIAGSEVGVSGGAGVGSGGPLGDYSAQALDIFGDLTQGVGELLGISPENAAIVLGTAAIAGPLVYLISKAAKGKDTVMPDFVDKFISRFADKIKGAARGAGIGFRSPEKIADLSEAKSPLAQKMKEIENQGRVAALETKLAAIAEMIEETNGRLTRIDEDNEFADMMDKNAVKEVRKQLKELERAKAKLEKEKAKMEGKGMKSYKDKEVMDEDEENLQENIYSWDHSTVDNTANMMTELTGIPLNILVPLLVWGVPLALIYGPYVVAYAAEFPGWIQNLIKKARAIFQKTGKSGEEVGDKVSALQAKASKDIAIAMSQAERDRFNQMKADLKESPQLDQFSDDQKMKFLQAYEDEYGVDVMESIEESNELNESILRMQKLAGLIKG